ncbi:hypothetical protein AX15_002699 [Amanita polypyramis BW_CC]|nr:hypothetical protein AX15_002699 [Amanita polypyramis BW_CC]
MRFSFLAVLPILLTVSVYGAPIASDGSIDLDARAPEIYPSVAEERNVEARDVVSDWRPNSGRRDTADSSWTPDYHRRGEAADTIQSPDYRRRGEATADTIQPPDYRRRGEAASDFNRPPDYRREFTEDNNKRDEIAGTWS